MMVLPRVLTALVAAPLFLAVVYLGSLPYALFIFLVILLSLWEFVLMAEEGGYATQSLWTVGLGGLLAASMAFPGLRPSGVFSAQAPALALAAAFILILAREMGRRDKGLSMLRASASAAGLLLVAWPLGHLLLLRELRGPGEALYHVGRDSVFFLTFIVWVQDTAAWAVGLSIGRRRMAPVLSPKKSWEGAAGGLLAAVITAMALREVWLHVYFSRSEMLALTVALGVLAQASDLAESLMKRCFGVKDSSALLPGHGGVLDRFDSFLFAAPTLYYYLIVTGRGG
jgi:phosphatidate cytidylyltransferase